MSQVTLDVPTTGSVFTASLSRRARRMQERFIAFDRDGASFRDRSGERELVARLSDESRATFTQGRQWPFSVTLESEIRFVKGDRLTLYDDGKNLTFEHFDGNAVFVNHVLQRADIGFIQRMGPVPDDLSMFVVNDARRAIWHRIKTHVLETMVALELGGLASIEGLDAVLQSRFKSRPRLAFSVDEQRMVPWSEMREAIGESHTSRRIARLLGLSVEVFDDEDAPREGLFMVRLASIRNGSRQLPRLANDG